MKVLPSDSKPFLGGCISRHFDKRQKQVSKGTAINEKIVVAPDLKMSKDAHHNRLCERLEVEREKTRREEERTKREEIKLYCQREKTKRLSLRIQLIQEIHEKELKKTYEI